MLSVRQAVERAQRFLLSKQDEDGFWRDYLLPPGPSTSWVTACVAHSLVGCELDDAPLALQRAEQALLAQKRPEGWGYSGVVACDADSTAAVLRFLAKQKNPACNEALSLLNPYINDDGGVRTFADRARFGRWAEPHAEIVPSVGLAFLDCGVSPQHVERLRTWSVKNQDADGSWTNFWWATRHYSTAKNLHFLAASGGIARCTQSCSLRWLSNQRVLDKPFNAAWLARIADACSSPNDVQTMEQIEALLPLQGADGSWPAYPALLVPSQWQGGGTEEANADVNRLMSTAFCLEALVSAM